MSKYAQPTLTLCYMLLVTYCTFRLLAFWHLHPPVIAVIAMTIVWMTWCFGAIYIKPDYFIYGKINVRLPILQEEQRLTPCLREVLDRATITRPFRLMIIEDMGLNAFAAGTNIIAISRGLMDKMTDTEIKAVMAHELGHHLSKDCIVGHAFASTAQVPVLIRNVYATIYTIFTRIFTTRDTYPGYTITRSRGIVFSLAFCLLLVALCYYHFLFPLLATIAYILIFNWIDPLFYFFWKAITRFIEYKQDAFAHSLGYGPDLRAALYKLVAGGPEPVSLRFVLHHSDHPITYNRIRRLEKLEGLRDEQDRLKTIPNSPIYKKSPF